MKGKRGRARLLERARPIIEEIAESKGKNGAFAYFEGKDIAQEVWVICLRALDAYDSKKGPLEHYLRRCVTNRLKNLRRDRYFRLPGDRQAKSAAVQDRINIVNALPLSGGDVAQSGCALGASSIPADPADILAAEELREEIEKRLPAEVLHDFRRLLEGDRLSGPGLDRVRREVAAVLEGIR